MSTTRHPDYPPADEAPIDSAGIALVVAGATQAVGLALTFEDVVALNRASSLDAYCEVVNSIAAVAAQVAGLAFPAEPT